MQRKILNAGHFLVFQFDVWDPTGKIRRKGNINCVPTASLKIATSLYKLKASINLEKSKTPSMTYVCIVSTSGKWLYCNYLWCIGQKVQETCICYFSNEPQQTALLEKHLLSMILNLIMHLLIQ